LFQFIWRRTVP